MIAAVQYLAQQLRVDPNAAALVAYRNKVGLATYAQQLLKPAKIRCILLDTGYPPAGLSVAQSERVLGVPCKEIVRVESVAESLLPCVGSVNHLLGRKCPSPVPTLAAQQRFAQAGDKISQSD